MNAAPMDRAHMLLARLENPSADDAELWELLHAIEVATFSRVEDRVRLVPGLLAAATLLQERWTPERAPMLRCALRRFASLVPAEEGLVLFQFLRAEDERTTQLCALQGLGNIYLMRAPPFGASDERLARLDEILDLGMTEESREVAERAVVGINAAIVWGLFQPSRVKELAHRIFALNDPSFTRMVSAKWYDAIRFRPKPEAALYKTAVAVLNGEVIPEEPKP